MRQMQWNGNELVFADEPNKGVAGIAPSEDDVLGEEIAARWNQGAPVWGLSMAWAYRDESDGRLYERALDTTFLAENKDDAVKSALRWIEDRRYSLSAFDHSMGVEFITCVKVWGKGLSRIDDDGKGGIRNGVLFGRFEWKYDTAYQKWEDLLKEHDVALKRDVPDPKEVWK